MAYQHKNIKPKNLVIDQGLVEIVMYDGDGGMVMEMYDEYSDNYVTTTLSDYWLLKIRNYINDSRVGIA